MRSRMILSSFFAYLLLHYYYYYHIYTNVPRLESRTTYSLTITWKSHLDPVSIIRAKSLVSKYQPWTMPKKQEQTSSVIPLAASGKSGQVFRSSVRLKNQVYRYIVETTARRANNSPACDDSFSGVTFRTVTYEWISVSLLRREMECFSL